MFEDGNEGGGSASVEVDAHSGGADLDAGGVGPTDVNDLGGSDAAPDAPAADSYRPPTREEWEETRRHADLGRELSPHAEQIREAMRAGLSRGQASQVVKEARAEGVSVASKIFGSDATYKKWLAECGGDRDVFKRGIGEVADEQFKPHIEKLTAHEQKIAAIESRLNEVYGAALEAEHRFQPRADYEKIRADAMKYATSKRIPFNEAVQVVKDRAELAALRAQVKKQSAAPGVEQAPARRVAGTPKEDKSLHPSRAPGGAGVGAPAFVPTSNGKGSKFQQALRHVARNRLAGKR